MLNKCNIGRTEIVCWCLALVGCILVIRPVGSQPLEYQLENCRPKKQNKPDPEDECPPQLVPSLSNKDKFKYDLEPSLSYYGKFKYDLTCEGITCDHRHDCGRAPMNTIRGDKFLPYIVNGQTQRYGNWPSFASVVRARPSGRFVRMVKSGGVIISPRHILTSYNNLIETDTGIMVPVPLGQFSIVVGDHSVGKDQHEKVYGLREVCRSKEFRLTLNDLHKYINSSVNDYAVLKLNASIQFDEFKQPACLPYKHDYDPPANKFIHCFMMGWGSTRDAEKDSRVPLHEQATFLAHEIHDMPVVAEPCRPPLPKYDSALCFKKIGKPGVACDEDVGSPVLCKNPRSNRWTVVGVVAAGMRSCANTPRDWQLKVTNVATLLSSIKKDCHI